MTDTFTVTYDCKMEDNESGPDVPTLMIARTTEDHVTIVNWIRGDQAVYLYNKLLEKTKI